LFYTGTAFDELAALVCREIYQLSQGVVLSEYFPSSLYMIQYAFNR